VFSEESQAQKAQASRMYLSCKGPAQETLHLHLRAALFCSLARKLALPFEGGDARAKKKPCIVFTISFSHVYFPHVRRCFERC